MPEAAGARLVWSFIHADELPVQLGGTRFLTSLPGVTYVWLCQPFSCQTGRIRVAVSCWQQNQWLLQSLEAREGFAVPVS